MTTWFQLKGGKVHMLVSVDDVDRFPLGRAHCAPFPRIPLDTLHKTNEVDSKLFCRLCVEGIHRKTK